ncbi:MAG: trimethylamine methyltransferase family protein [Candidatus Bathyarchaeota archaeon]
MAGARLNLLSKDELSSIHNATLEILENPGLMIPSERALNILETAGANVNYKENTTSIPSSIVEEALKRAPKTIKYSARNPKYDILLEKKKTYFTTDGYGTFIRDFETGERRSSTAEDLAKWTILADYLPMIHVFWPSLTPNDVPEPLQEINTWVISLNNTEKHVEGGASNASEAQFSIEIAAAIVGGKEELRKRPIISVVQCPISPLRFESGLIEANIEYAKAGVPVVPLTMPLAGETAPVTLAGTLAVNNAEVLGSLVVSEFASSGAPVLYGACPSNIDFRTGLFICSPESGLLNVALAQLAHYYDLPSEICGGCSDSKVPDAQAAYERTLTLLPAILAGPDIVCGMGGLEAAKTMVPELLIIDNEILEGILRLVRGFEVNDDTLALDVIRKVGLGGHYLAEKHTLNRFMKEHWMPKISDRRAYDLWKREGEKGIHDVAREKANEILATHKPEPLPKDVQKEISLILKRYEKFLKQQE